ncbi:MAG: purine-nucleoside phosphorylase [Candidatus Firestonebacteria bacterium]|nr:purine-nucleoside phosphorylase [Candidatus Firestonebacteria bacterium]
MNDLYAQVQEAVKVIRKHTALKPEVAMTLGTGLGALAHEFKPVVKIPYADIPHFPLSTVETHAGQLLIGKLQGKTVVAMQGRFHRYEGYDLKQVTFPVRVMRALGAKTYMVFSACGGIHRDFYAGDLMLLKDHINLMGDNPLIGPNDTRLGPRFPDLFDAYDSKLRALAMATAREQKLPLQQGVYAALTGPTLETVAEYRYLQTVGADCVGMSTVPEVIVARHAGLRVLGIGVITDRCVPDQVGPANIEEIIHAAMQAEPKLTRLVKGVLSRL